MKYIITESQYKLISEKVERTWRDREHEHQYPKLSNKLIPLISNMVKSYSEYDDHKIALKDSDNNILILFLPYRFSDKVSKNGEIYSYLNEATYGPVLCAKNIFHSTLVPCSFYTCLC